jgi:hypothetical protein
VSPLKNKRGLTPINTRAPPLESEPDHPMMARLDENTERFTLTTTKLGSVFNSPTIKGGKKVTIKPLVTRNNK